LATAKQCDVLGRASGRSSKTTGDTPKNQRLNPAPIGDSI
jgi:hypothetical protein